MMIDQLVKAMAKIRARGDEPDFDMAIVHPDDQAALFDALCIDLNETITEAGRIGGIRVFTSRMVGRGDALLGKSTFFEHQGTPPIERKTKP